MKRENMVEDLEDKLSVEDKFSFLNEAFPDEYSRNMEDAIKDDFRNIYLGEMDDREVQDFYEGVLPARS